MEGRFLKTSSASPESEFDIPRVSIYALSPKEGTLSDDSISSLLDRARKFSSEHGIVLQFFDREKIHGKEQLISALYHALRSKATGRSRTRELSVDIARYAAGERQIHVALRQVGLKEGTSKIIVLVFFPIEVRDKQEELENKLLGLFTELRMQIEPGLEFDKEGLAEALERTALVELKL